MRKKQYILSLLDALEVGFKQYQYSVNRLQEEDAREFSRRIQELITEIQSNIEAEDEA